MINAGQIYRHYKGNVYEVLALALHSESGEPLVIYRQVSDHLKIWARPAAMFEEKLPDGRERFALIEEDL